LGWVHTFQLSVGLGWVGLGWVRNEMHFCFHTKCTDIKYSIVQFMNIVDLLDHVIKQPNALLVFCIVIADFECL